jgi:arsenite methyltransferase
MHEAGLVELTLTPKPEYLQTLGRMERPVYQTIASHLPEGTTPADYITSLDISARKSSS